MYSIFRPVLNSRQARRKPQRQVLAIEQLEDRLVPSTFTVSTLSDSGAGSLRQAILNANSHPGADTIQFSVAGTIRLSSGTLPAITGTVDIEGATASGYAGQPVVEVNFNHYAGLLFAAGSSGSELNALSLVDASDSGVTISGANGVTIAGNFIGVTPGGITAAGNGGDGLFLNNTTGDTIGDTGPSSGATTFQLSNVISGNGGNGIGLNHASNNTIAMNFIGTDITGTVAIGNAQNGILVTDGSTGNLIGGEATGGNAPTLGVFVQPPQGNLISGNGGDGVFINGEATSNQLSGNFIGTSETGNAPLGNGGDGVAIQNANGNSLLGCTIQTDPFVFYNVISGNGGNGLRVTNANTTTIQANFFGMGANNDTDVGNHLNGVLVNGSSTGTVMGGPIPLGNVDACNGENGVEVAGTASNFVTYNTFCGLAAFSIDPYFGNAGDGMLITSTGSNILVRTCVITENGANGIEVGGNATGVRIAGNLIGLDTNGNAAMGNLGDGILVDGNAHSIIIGGPQATFNVIFHNAISANEGNGVAVTGKAHNVTISYSYIGTDLIGGDAFGNALAGIYLGSGTYGTTIGSVDPTLTTVVSGNLGNGIEIDGSNGNTVFDTLIGTDATGVLPLGNAASGVLIVNSNANTIGTTTAPAGVPANIIAFNGEDGVYIQSGTGNHIHTNSIFANTGMGIDLAPATTGTTPAPVLTAINPLPVAMEVSGTLTGAANTVYTIQFFASDTSAASGRIYLGSLAVRTNRTGVARFMFTGELPPSNATYITATATDAGGNTSEFSAAASAT